MQGGPRLDYLGPGLFHNPKWNLKPWQGHIPMGVTEFRGSHSTNYTTFYFFPYVNKQTWVWLLTPSPRSQLRGVPNILQGLQTRMAFLGIVNIMFLLMSVKIYEFLNHWQLRWRLRQGNHWLPAQEWTGAGFLTGFLRWDLLLRDCGEDSIQEMLHLVGTWQCASGEISVITPEEAEKGVHCGPDLVQKVRNPMVVKWRKNCKPARRALQRAVMLPLWLSPASAGKRKGEGN